MDLIFRKLCELIDWLIPINATTGIHRLMGYIQNVAYLYYNSSKICLSQFETADRIRKESLFF